MKLADEYLPRTCSVKDCQNAPTHRAEIVIYAAVDKLHKPAIGYLPICTCDAHADAEHARALLADEGKHQIECGFMRAGYAKPDWKRSHIRWVRL